MPAGQSARVPAFAEAAGKQFLERLLQSKRCELAHETVVRGFSSSMNEGLVKKKVNEQGLEHAPVLSAGCPNNLRVCEVIKNWAKMRNYGNPRLFDVR
jgi:hypothetical protein